MSKLFENFQILHEVDTLLEMAMLRPEKANKERCGNLDVYIYFSDCQDSHGPRVKFYGGTKETKFSKNAPSLSFGVNGAEEVVIQSWMNKKNCPNAFNKNVIENVKQFVNKTLSILLLVWFEKIDSDYALDYFQGHVDFSQLLNYIDEVDDETKQELLASKDLSELHEKCKRYSLYNF